MSDIAVIEIRNEDSWGMGEWEQIARIGPDRTGGPLQGYWNDGEPVSLCNVRIRYLNSSAAENEEKP